jgi:signal transduction histidine kinase
MEIRLPLIAAAFISLAAIATAQFAIYWQWRDLSQRTALLGAVYLDNLSANVAPKVARRDIDGAALALRRTLNYYEGLRDESLFLLDREGNLLAQAQRGGAPAASTMPPAVRSSPFGTLDVPFAEIAWVWRPLVYEGESIGTLIAALDVAPLYEKRRALSGYVLLAGIAVSVVTAVLGTWIIRRHLRPVMAVTTHLREVAAGHLADIAETSRESETFATLRKAFNQMVAAMRERESMARRLAEQSRAAILGRLAATIVHEVKNPLGGMQTAVETLKKYGGDRVVREEAVGLIERGLETVEHVIDATLDSYKVPDKRRPLAVRDIEDVKTLIEAEARQRGVDFECDIDIPETTALPAVETRQVLLNLLLNACRATARNGTVSFCAAVIEDGARFEISDNGPGLDPNTARALETGEGSDSGGLGLSIVRKLVDRLNGTISILTVEPHGTRVVVTLPLVPEDVAT